MNDTMNDTMRKLIFFVLITLSCGGSNFGVNPPPADKVKAQELIDQAWIEFENDRFQKAIERFNEARNADNAIVDTFNGLGWSYFHAHDLNNSLFSFASAIGSDSSFTDAMVGNGIAAFEENDYEISITSLTTIIRVDSLSFDFQGTDYIFEHDNSVTAKLARKILALSYYYSSDFEMAFDQYIKFFDSNPDFNKESENYLISLLEALERI